MLDTYKAELLDKLTTQSATIAVIGLGYVGLPLAVVFAESGFSVVGIDVDPAKVDAIGEGHSYIGDIPSERLSQVAGGKAIAQSPGNPVTLSPGHLTATTDYSLLAQCDVAIICVPTPLNKTRDPDVHYHDPYVAEFAHSGAQPVQRERYRTGVGNCGLHAYIHLPVCVWLD